jgi:hypothetical protein
VHDEAPSKERECLVNPAEVLFDRWPNRHLPDMCHCLRRHSAFSFRQYWADATTGRQSTSLGLIAYRDALARDGLAVRDEFDDVEGNHYYVAAR